MSGDRKLEAFMQAAGLERWLVDLEQVERLDELLDDPTPQPVPRALLRSAHSVHTDLARRALALLPGRRPSRSP